MTVIELGLVSQEGDEHDDGPGPGPMRPRDRRRMLVALVAAGCLLTTAGSARPEPHGLTQLWSAPFSQDADAFRLIDGTLYLLSRRTDRQLTAHDPRTGAVRWSVADVGDSTWITAVAAGKLLMPTGTTTITHEEPDGSSSSREFSRDTMAIDTATGRRVWRERGEFTALVGDRVLLSEWNETGERADRLRLVRLSDGGTVWTRDRGELAFWATDATLGTQVERLVTVTSEGRAEVIAATDGTVLATGQLPWSRETADYSGITVEGRRLYLDQTIKFQASVSVYDTDTLRRLWRIEQPSSGGTYGCGPVLCISDGTSLAGHDRDTGVQRWKLAGATGGYPLLGDRLMIDEDSGTRRALVNAATGHQVADLGLAMPVWDSQGRGTPYLIARTRQPAGLTSVSTFDPETARVELRGATGAVLDYSCQTEDGLLACVDERNQLTVTDVG